MARDVLLRILKGGAALAACAAPCAQASTVNGATLGAAWGLPFALMLLSIALVPMFAAAFWHRHFGKISAFWALAFLLPFALTHGVGATYPLFVHALVDEYVPFIVLLGALYTIAGGICIYGNLRGSPRTNTTILLLGTVLASVMGTTGAAMLLIRPLLRANDNRRHTVHVVVFFIVLVANAGGSLTPLGDPPLFLGFLNGVSFFWTTQHLAVPMLFVCAVLLAAFWVLDSWYFRRADEVRDARTDPTPDSGGIAIGGKLNFVLLAGVIALVLMSGVWKPGIGVDLPGARLELQNLVRDAGLIVLAALSLACTSRTARADNGFDWAPIAEVAKLFAGIFVTITPVIAMLKAGEHGAFASLIQFVNDAPGRPNDALYFWATGLLSSFLDNAPTWLVFFNLAGGDAPTLMTSGARTLAAISAGAVWMGAMTYIGNAPNFMVRAIAQQRGVRMPGFFGYLGWSCVLLTPVFAAATWLFFV
ncbi:Na+/H+ antiporter NhaD/arsenite permease-like protein [Paraburkholderia bannensis]|uniref:Na+/H+ antiporter NhaD/arsenite permease-like protein n=1 Tax=Paraburkholderia bannensis TaxID=765414 RepID=A0A7W9WNR8_9BURK|nr:MULTISPECIES: sodium:proton antiporter [Paraburkholderia]MBB3255654.1 Na+/H+ antiporter NhaD/arsenite permease-like protein [Paraburkholderia sp. WP4_3_2]MBB6100335.1 Na+/H+ antiporter NhaD/arsenite permease-like protein [Paraburkholderia bannensis]